MIFNGKYVSPFDVISAMLSKAIIISEEVIKLDNYNNWNKKSYLRKQTEIDSYSINGLKLVHSVMTFLAIAKFVEFRSGAEGVFEVLCQMELVNKNLIEMKKWSILFVIEKRERLYNLK